MVQVNRIIELESKRILKDLKIKGFAEVRVADLVVNYLLDRSGAFMILLLIENKFVEYGFQTFRVKNKLMIKR